MRFVSAIGATVFAYLAVLAFAFLASTLDNACTGPGCESAPAIRVLIVALYASCLLSLGATASLFAAHALSGSTAAFAGIPAALKACMTAVGITLFFLVCLISTLAAVLLIVTAIITWQLLYRHGKREAERSEAGEKIRRRVGSPPPDPNLN